MSDIRGTLEQIRNRLNELLGIDVPRGDDRVILSNLVDPQGHPIPAAKDKVVMFLAGIQQGADRSVNPKVSAAGSPAVVAPPLYIDLFILFYANFSDQSYPEGLAAISSLVDFFQQNPVLTRETLPDLDPRLEKVAFEMINLDPVALNALMSLAGARYLPSVYYRVRMIPAAGG